MKKKAFLVNGIILTLSSLAGRFLYMGFRVWLSQMIGAEGMGAYQLILSVFLPAVSISTAGVSLTVTRLVTSAIGKKQPGTIPSAVARCCGFSLLMSFLACAALWCSADFLSVKFLGGNSADALRMLLPGLPFMALSACMRGYFLAVRGVLRSAVSEFAEQLATISLTVSAFLAFSPRTIADACLLSMLGATVGEAVSCGCSFVLYRLHVRRFKSSQNRPCTSAGKAILHITLPSTLSHAARSVLSAAENLLIPLGLRKCGASATAALAQYGMLQGMVMPMLFFPSCFLGAFASLLIPEMSESLAAGKKRSISSGTERSLRMTLWFSIFTACFFFAFGEELGVLFYRSQEAGKLLRMLAPLVPLLYLDMVTDGLLKGLDQQIRSLLYNTLDTSLRVSLMAVLLPVLGLKGYFIILYSCGILNVTLSLSRLLKTAHVHFSIFQWILFPLFAAIICLLTWQSLSITISSCWWKMILALLFTGCGYSVFLWLFFHFLQKRKGIFSHSSLTKDASQVYTGNRKSEML